MIQKSSMNFVEKLPARTVIQRRDRVILRHAISKRFEVQWKFHISRLATFSHISII